ncbi:hypothetical protein VSU16_14530 (plasmid) [Cetobacterium somerae]|uniref:hypothetical protein n=1 Tax=Cetobacterium somerae TaxID=188913 RepID=UPI002E7B3B35|nr:hypothetical protein [Cetobacterium somerae]WVJ03137.1 hypothetical protein VSU16_14530 [Cetobacterium somerae]
MSKNTIISIAKNNDIPRYSGLYFNFPGKILVDNLSIPNLKYNEYDSILEIKKKKENSKHSNLKK